ncbi:ankyrin repeat-containing protein [Penicillium malachiteum]|uniref:Ankyrin repeat-containing protein n=1 Tax=Penicillium malachiteum TaxID=1324776 RepID=A0AAD6HWN5_9EURO|nr:ankyrin repeat-containing protein [Penicillium malachiteum]
MDEQATTKAHRFLKFGRKADKESKKAGAQQREAPNLIPKSGHNIDGWTVKASEQLLSSDHRAGHTQTTEKLTFWERAYSEIVNDTDQDIQKLVETYGILLHDNSNEEHGLENEVAKTQAKSADSDLFANYDDPFPESSSKADEDSLARHPVGDEAHMRKFATVRLVEMQSKEWKVKWRGKEIFNVRKQVSTIVQIVEKFSGFLGSVAALDTSQHAGLAWAGVCVLLPLITNDTEERQKAIDGIEVMARITARYTAVDRDYTSGSMNRDPSFEKALVRIYLKITLFYMKASFYFSQSTLKRTVRGTFAADAWTSAQSAVEQADQECQKFAVSLGLSTFLAKTDKILDSLREIQLDDHIDRVKKWLLHDVDVEYQHASTREKLGAQYRESGKWLLDSEEFKDWMQSSRGQFWIQGLIGTGKTSLVSTIIDHVKQNFENLAFFYFSGNFEGSASGINMHLTKVLRALIGQLALSPTGDRIAEKVDLSFAKAVEKGTLRSPVPLDFEQASKLLVKIINSREETIIILDGLDEFPSFVSLLSNLHAIDCDANNLKILLSSQYVVPVDRFFPSTVAAVSGGKDSFPDMKMFVGGELRRFQAQRPNLIDEDLAADIIQTLPEKAEGTFKWAELSLKAVLDPDSEIDAKEINANWQSIKSTQFQWITRDFIRIYEVFYEKSLPTKHQAGLSSEEQKAERALLWLLGADNTAESADGVSEAQISKICRNFLFLSDEGTVTLSHSSVRDYLTLKLARQVEKFLHADEESKNTENTNEDVLKTARETSLQLANSRICTECLDVILHSKNWTKKGSSPLLTYACKFWPKHAALCHDKCFRDDILPRIKILFHGNDYDIFRGWVFVFDDVESNQLRIWTNDFELGQSSEEPDPLYYAVILGMPDIVQFCLDQGSSATSKGGKYGFPLQTACYLGNINIISMMLPEADINNVDNVYGTPLQAPIIDANVRGETFGTASQMALALNDTDILA